jgi:hypothetical protein
MMAPDLVGAEVSFTFNSPMARTGAYGLLALDPIESGGEVEDAHEG